MEFEIKEIPYGSQDYRKSLDLRNRVLRMPLGMNLYDENLERDSKDIHIGAYHCGSLIGILILAKKGEDTVQMRQVAVDEAYRMKGAGKMLVSFSENTARRIGYSNIVLHARETAAPFYTKLGYAVKGDTFIEVGIPHHQMEKTFSSL